MDTNHQLQSRPQENFRMKNYLKIYLPILFTLFLLDLAISQNDDNEIKIVRPVDTFGQKPIPVSLDGFSGEVESVLKFDLYVQGFSFVSQDAAQYQISGSNSGNVIGHVSDKFARKEILSRSYTGASLRREAHAL